MVGWTLKGKRRVWALPDRADEIFVDFREEVIERDAHRIAWRSGKRRKNRCAGVGRSEVNGTQYPD